MRTIGLIILTGMLVGCGSEAQNSSTSSSTIFGKAERRAVIYLKDASTPVKELSTDTDDQGGFQINTIGYTPPYLLKSVAFDNSSTAYTIASNPSGTVNIDKHSTWLVQIAAGTLDLVSLWLTLKGTVLIVLSHIASSLAAAL